MACPQSFRSCRLSHVRGKLTQVTSSGGHTSKEREGGESLGGRESNVVSFSVRRGGFILDWENKVFLHFGFLSASAVGVAGACAS